MSVYGFCKYLTQLTCKFYYHKVVVSGIENIPPDKPVLLAINHPNSFLDAVLVGAHLSRPTHFLARGDAFKNKRTLPILTSLNMLPVHRLSEGKENLNKNTETFDSVFNILTQRKVILIFAEGLSENNWELRSMKKGPARITLRAWNSDTPANELRIIPVGLTYEHYRGAGKNILINIGKPILKSDFTEQNGEAIFVRQFNQKIYDALGQLAYVNKDMKPDDLLHQNFRAKFQLLTDKYKTAPLILKGLYEEHASTLISNNNYIKQTLIFWPLYLFCNYIAKSKMKSDLFFDSVSFGLFLFLWPVYSVLLIILLLQFV